MTLAHVMALHGKALGPLGVAVYAWIEANPGSTFKEVADGLGMGESTVKRCVRQFEELGIASRLIETTPKGLALPTRIYPGTIERGTSDNPLRVVTPSAQNPVTIEQVENTGVSLSDPGTIERGTSGTEVAPSKAKNTSTEKKEANASRASARGERHAYIGRLLGFRESVEGGRLASHGIEAGAAKWLFDRGYSEDEAQECYRYLIEQSFRGEVVTLKTVMNNIGAWKRGELSDGKRTEPKQSKPTRADTLRNRDYSVFDGAGGEDFGNDSRPLPGVKRLAGQVGR